MQFSRPTRSTCAHFSPEQWKNLFPRADPEPPVARDCVRAGVPPPCRHGEAGDGVDFPVASEEVESERSIKTCLETASVSVRLVPLLQSAAVDAQDPNHACTHQCADLVAESGVFGTAVVLAERVGSSFLIALRQAIEHRLRAAGATRPHDLSVQFPIFSLRDLAQRLVRSTSPISNGPIWTIIVLGAHTLGSLGHGLWARSALPNPPHPTVRSIVLLGDFSMPSPEPGLSLAHYYWGDNVAFEMRERALRDWGEVEQRQQQQQQRPSLFATPLELASHRDLQYWLTRDSVPKDGPVPPDSRVGTMTVSRANRTCPPNQNECTLFIRLDVARRLSLEDWTLAGKTAARWKHVLLVDSPASTATTPTTTTTALPPTLTLLVTRSQSRPPRLTVDLPPSPTQ